MDLPDFLTRDPLGEIHLTGHRIGLFSVIDRYQQGYSPEMLAEEFPTLPLALIHRVLAFYLENMAEADAYVLAHRAELDRQESANDPSAEARKIRERIQARPQTAPVLPTGT